MSPKNNIKKIVKSNILAAGRKIPKYKENLRMNIQQKYLQKLEEQDDKYSKIINNLKIDYTGQIEELQDMLSSASSAVIEAQNITLVKIRELYDIIFEKDNKVQELEEKIEEMEDINKK